MAFDLKAATPDTTFPSGGFLFGADSQSATDPSVYSDATFMARFNLYAGTNLLEQRNGANAQTFNVYNTYTDASNYERGVIKWASNVLEIGAEDAGTGSSRALKLKGGGFELVMNTSVNSGATFIAAGEIVGQFRRSNSVDGQLRLPSDNYGLAFGSTNTSSATAGLSYAADGVIKPTNGAGGAGAMQFDEMGSAPTAEANAGRIYAEDNGSGKTRLMVVFGTGAAQQIAIEP